MVYWSAALLLTLTAIAWASTAVQDAPTQARLLLHPKTTGEMIFWVLVVAPTAGFCEEVLFRGMLLSFIARETGDVLLAIALPSLAFGALHYAQGLFAVVVTGVMAALFAAVAVHTGSLWPGIVAHTLYDAVAPFLFRLDEPQDAS
jgi:membrane protease YdiL (CAAX protease family)